MDSSPTTEDGCVDVSFDSWNGGDAVEAKLVPDIIGNWSKLRRRTPLASKSDSYSQDERSTPSPNSQEQKVFFIKTKKEESRDDTSQDPSPSSSTSSSSPPSQSFTNSRKESESSLPYDCLNTPHARTPKSGELSDEETKKEESPPNTNQGQELKHESGQFLETKPVTKGPPKAILLGDGPLTVEIQATSPGIRSEFQAPHLPPTKLHELCEHSQTISDLIKARDILRSIDLPRKDILDYAGTRDSKGRTPLHLLSENKEISDDLAKADQDEEVPFFHDIDVEPKCSFENNDPSREKNLENFVIGFLMLASPSAAMSRDDEGRIPFEGAIANWVNQCHDQMLHNKGPESKNELTFPTASLVVTNALKLAKMTAKKTMNVVSSNSTRKMDESSKRESGNSAAMSPDVERGGTRSSVLGNLDETTPSDRPSAYMTQEMIRARCFPVHVRLTSHVFLALKMLSKVIEKLDKLTSSRSLRRVTDTSTSPGSLQEADSFDNIIEQSFAGVAVYQEIKEAIIFNIASVPDFVKTILLIKDDAEREFALSTTIVKRVLMSKYSIGPWLTAMLQGNKRVSKRAVEYLKYISELSAQQRLISKKARSSSRSNFESGHDEEPEDWTRDQLHNEISRLQDFVPSLLSLGEKGVEDAATTMVVRRVMDRIISSPFAVSVIFCDALFLAILIFGYRSAVNNLILRGNPRAVMRGIYVANTGIFYFIIRELGKIISLCMITRSAKDYVKSFWNWTDLMATALALISVITIRSISRADDGLNIVDMHGIRDLLAITTGFLWLRVLSLLKGVNMQMATFILAILQITRDTLTFGIILIVMVITFAQMFFTVLVPSYCSAEGELDDPESQCVQAEYYFKVYTVLLGEFGAFERSSFKTWFSLVMMVVYSFMVIIVLLNVLIAVASDSYEKCLMKSQSLFGRARVMLIAELVSFQNLLRKSSDSRLPSNGQPLTPNSRMYDRWWANQSFARDWSQGSMLFFALSSLVVVFWGIGEIAGYASGERYGSVLLSVGSLLINMTLFAFIILFLSRGSENIVSKRGDLVPAESNVTDNSGLPPFLQRIMLRVMGSSQDTWNLFRESDQKEDSSDEWRGRVHHLQSRMDQLMQESAKNSMKQTQTLEQMVANTEMRLKSDMTIVDQNVNSLKAELLSEIKQNQEASLIQIQKLMKQMTEDMERNRSIF